MKRTLPVLSVLAVLALAVAGTALFANLRASGDRGAPAAERVGATGPRVPFAAASPHPG